MREAVQIHERRYMTEREKLQRWEECGRCCMVCHTSCEPLGPYVIWDHRIQLGIGGTNELSNMEPHHTGVCAKLKTKIDAMARAKVNRLRRAQDPETRKHTKRPLKGRGFQKTLRRKVDGTVQSVVPPLGR